MRLCAGVVCLTSIFATVFETRQKLHRLKRQYWCFVEDSKSVQWRQRPQHKNETESLARNAHVFDFNANYNRNRNREQNIIFSHMTRKKTGHNMLQSKRVFSFNLNLFVNHLPKLIFLCFYVLLILVLQLRKKKNYFIFKICSILEDFFP